MGKPTRELALRELVKEQFDRMGLADLEAFLAGKIALRLDPRSKRLTEAMQAAIAEIENTRGRSRTDSVLPDGRHDHGYRRMDACHSETNVRTVVRQPDDSRRETLSSWHRDRLRNYPNTFIRDHTVGELRTALAGYPDDVKVIGPNNRPLCNLVPQTTGNLLLCEGYDDKSFEGCKTKFEHNLKFTRAPILHHPV